MGFKKFIALDNPIRLIYHTIRAMIANFIYGFPSRKMIIIGVTGTNGKTTSVNIIAKGLQKKYKGKIFMFSTINYIVGDEEFRNDTKMTSPDPFILQKLLKAAKKKGCQIAIIETSSHAIIMNRILGISYDILLLTNITQDHLDLHHTMDNYAKTKLKLFKKLISQPRKTGVNKVAVINLESQYKELFINETYDILTTYGYDFASNLRPIDIDNGIDFLTFNIKIPGGTIDIKTKLRGKHNIYNILGAIGVFQALGLKPNDIKEAIENIEYIPGRLEDIKNNEGFKVFVDYAHTPDGLENVLETIRDIKGVKRIITVFGATGDRDRKKRPIMGRIVSELSDFIILTQDDDYSESPQRIIKDILPGIERKEGNNFWIIIDREDAIKVALLIAKKGDVVLIAGKGDEHKIITNDGPRDYSDKNVALDIFKEIDENKFL